MFKLAWRNIWRNKSRSLISIAAVFFSVFFAILMRSFALGTYAHMIDTIMGNYYGYVQVHGNGYWDDQTLDNSFEDREALQEQILANNQVVGIASRLEGFSLVSSGNITKGTLILGVNTEQELPGLKLKDRIVSGKNITAQSHEVVVGKDLAAYLKVGVNDTLYFIGQGYQAQSAYGKFAISGIANMQNPEFNKSMVLMSLADAQYMFACPGRLTTYALQLESGSDYRAIAANLSATLAPSDNYEVLTWEELFPDVVQGIEADSAGGLVFILILYVIIGFVLFGTVIMMVAERKIEFGILVSIGMKKGVLATITMLESVLLALIGGLLGIAVSRPIMHYFNANPIQFGDEMKAAFEDYGYEAIMPASIDWSISLTHGIIVTLIAFAISFYAVFKIYRLNPVEAVRP